MKYVAFADEIKDVRTYFISYLMQGAWRGGGVLQRVGDGIYRPFISPRPTADGTVYYSLISPFD